jgi:hypothetical protein
MRAIVLSLLSALAVAPTEQTQAPPPKADIVAVTGCVKEAAPGSWTLVNASDPVVSVANTPSPKELASLPKGGKNEFRLIGVTVFNLPAHRDHSVIVKGVHIKASPMSRLNVTSVTMVAATCPPPPGHK